MDHTEIEVKFLPENMQTIANRIITLGGESRGRRFETNIVYDTRQGRLKKRKSLLRLRKDREATLTFKSASPSPDENFKIRRELEVGVSDFDTMHLILESAGYKRQFIYEKWRETFELGGTLICMDTMPYGDFLEIEGQREAIRSVADQMGLPWERRILKNYHEIFRIISGELDLAFTDITFANFRGLAIDCRTYQHLL